MTVRRSYLIRILPVWILVLIVGSLMPGSAKVAIGSTTHVQSSSPNQNAGASHRIYHFMSFGSTAILVILANKNRRRQLAAAAAVFALGAGLEFTQQVIYGSPLEWWDIRDDLYGVLGGLLLSRGKFLEKLVTDE